MYKFIKENLKQNFLQNAIFFLTHFRPLLKWAEKSYWKKYFL